MRGALHRSITARSACTGPALAAAAAAAVTFRFCGRLRIGPTRTVFVLFIEVSP
jgi:hypothetical protein